MNNNIFKNKKGFTLIELLIVIFIIVLIGSLVTVYFFQIRKNVRDSKRLSDISEIQLALENYKFFEDQYPVELIPGEPLIGSTTEKIFLIKVPQNPSYYNSDCISEDYHYYYDDSLEEYKISFCLEGNFENYNNGPKCAFMGEIFEGNCFFCESSVSDIDGNVYNTVAIEDQCWMSENLRVTKYNNGNDILYPGIDISSWVNNTEGAYACWENDTGNCITKGAFYNFYAIINSNGLCPEGWHVPSHNEMTQLERNVCLLAGNDNEYCESTFLLDEVSEGIYGTDEGKRLKSVSYGGLDSHGFNIIPTGYRHDNGEYYSSGENWAYLYTSTEASSTAWRRLFGPEYDNIQRAKNSPKARGCSVRCLKDQN
ncbi:MAG TPA: fibrobacter succinogenes major paralogous domain-containing protein [bacterium]|nr:fibrobacter succinogenes major paralogous domain-containing protein [bacterium]